MGSGIDHGRGWMVGAWVVTVLGFVERVKVIMVVVSLPERKDEVWRVLVMNFDGKLEEMMELAILESLFLWWWFLVKVVGW